MNKSILSTKILSQSQKSLLLNAGLSLVEYDAITVTLLDLKTERKIYENAIVTSQNTVAAMIKNNIHIENCFCVGTKTKDLLQKNGFNVVENADYGKDLAEKIVENHPKKSFIFFCGNRKLDDIPSVLYQNKIPFNEIEIYQTEFNPKKINKNFDAILFYSPSGVQSFVIKNKLENTIAVCIGTTTAAEAKKHTEKIVIAAKPTVENVIVKAVKTFASLRFGEKKRKI